MFRSIELPGGLKVEYKELEKAAADAQKAGLLDMAGGKKEQPAYILIAEQDPNLALAGLRIEIEKRLRSIAEARGVEPRRGGIGQIMRALQANQGISPAEPSVLNDLIALLNNAVHGAAVDRDAVGWAIDVGPQLLAALDKRIAQPNA